MSKAKHVLVHLFIMYNVMDTILLFIFIILVQTESNAIHTSKNNTLELIYNKKITVITFYFTN